jgi:hypothetical protein
MRITGRENKGVTAFKTFIGASPMSATLLITLLGAYLAAIRFLSNAYALAVALALFAIVHMAGGY